MRDRLAGRADGAVSPRRGGDGVDAFRDDGNTGGIRGSHCRNPIQHPVGNALGNDAVRMTQTEGSCDVGDAACQLVAVTHQRAISAGGRATGQRGDAWQTGRARPTP